MVLRITLPDNAFSPGLTQQVDAMLTTTRELKRALTMLQDEISQSERLRDQFFIHFRQCQEDSGILRSIFRKLRLKCDIGKLKGEGYVNSIPEVAPPVQQPPAPAPRPPERFSLTISPPGAKVRLRVAIDAGQVVCSCHFAPDGRRLTFSDGTHLRVIDTADGTELQRVQLVTTEQYTRAIRFSIDGRLIAVSAGTGVHVYEGHQQVGSLTGHAKDVAALCFGHRSVLVSGGFDGQLFAWNVASQTPIKRICQPQDNAIVAIAYAPGFWAVGFLSGVVGLIDAAFDSPLLTFSAHSQILMRLAVSEFDSSVVTASQDATVKVWDIDRVAICRHTLEGHSDFVLGAAVSPKEPVLVTGSKDQTIRVWDMKDGHPVVKVSAHKNTLFCVEHHPSQRIFASCGGDCFVCLWDYSELEVGTPSAEGS
jgi:WD40 repeat protein